MTHQPTLLTQKNNSKHLMFEANFLLERYHGQEWPPSPRKLFLAFVAALHQGSEQRVQVKEGEDALRYLESKLAPIIQCAGDKGTKYKLYVPNNDQDIISEAYKKGKNPTIDPSKLTTEKKITPHIVNTIQYFWEINDYDENKKNIDVLCKLANEIPVLGLGIDPVSVHGKIIDEIQYMNNATRYISDENSDDVRIHIPIQGLLDDAKKHHKEFLERIDKGIFIKPNPITRYRNEKYRKDTPSTEILTFKITDIIKEKQTIAEFVVPELIMNLDRLKTDVTGHNQEIKATVLPSIGGKHSDSIVRRVAFILPPSTSKEIKKTLEKKINSEIIQINAQQYQLETITKDDKVQNYYDRKSRSWRSVTPIDLELKNNATRQEITKAILDSLKIEKIDNAVTFVNFRKEPYWSNLPKVSGKTSMYAEIEFKSRIKGPFVLGKNQELGHGLFAPSQMPDVAYFAILGIRPQIEKTIEVAETMRSSVMSKIKDKYGSQSIQSNISGHDAYGSPLRENHQQAFWLPVDTDHDGLIDHIAVYMRGGFETSVQDTFYKVIELKNKNNLRVNVFFKGFYSRDSLSKKCQLFRKEKVWVSVTPYFMPWHVKKSWQRVDQLKKESMKHWGYNHVSKVEEYDIQINNRIIPTTNFQNIHNHKKPINRIGQAIKITFEKEVRGPVMLGSYSHFGLGMFLPASP